MSTYHVLGITMGGCLEAVASDDFEYQVLKKALPFAHYYRQLFLVKKAGGVRELNFVPPDEGSLEVGVYGPKITSQTP